MIRYYKLWDLLLRRGMKKSDLREIISSATIAKLSKGENVNTDIIDKICLYLKCQPDDIMEVIDEEHLSDDDKLNYKHKVIDEDMDLTLTEVEHERKISNLSYNESFEIDGNNRQIIDDYIE